MTNNELFFNLYNAFDNVLRKHYNIEDSNQSVIVKRINELKNSSSALKRKRGERLDIIRNLRNSLAHIEKFNNDDNFIIKANLIKALKNEIEDIKKPLLAIDICRPIDKVIYANINDLLIPLIEKMVNEGYSHIPILSNGILVGVFSENSVFNSLYKTGNNSLNNSTKVSEYLPFIDIDKHSSRYFLFVSKNIKVDNLYELFNNKKQNKKLAMIFITENGKVDENVLGIITSYDLIKY